MRKLWEKGDQVEVSNQVLMLKVCESIWSLCEVVDITEDNGGEWLMINCLWKDIGEWLNLGGVTTVRAKVRRFSSNVRPVRRDQM